MEACNIYFPYLLPLTKKTLGFCETKLFFAYKAWGLPQRFFLWGQGTFTVYTIIHSIFLSGQLLNEWGQKVLVPFIPEGLISIHKTISKRADSNLIQNILFCLSWWLLQGPALNQLKVSTFLSVLFLSLFLLFFYLYIRTLVLQLSVFCGYDFTGQNPWEETLVVPRIFNAYFPSPCFSQHSSSCTSLSPFL